MNLIAGNSDEYRFTLEAKTPPTIPMPSNVSQSNRVREEAPDLMRAVLRVRSFSTRLKSEIVDLKEGKRSLKYQDPKTGYRSSPDEIAESLKRHLDLLSSLAGGAPNEGFVTDAVADAERVLSELKGIRRKK